MKSPSLASINIQFVNKAVQDAIRRCDRIVVIGSSDDYQKIYFFTDRKNYFRYYTIDLNAIDTTVPKRFQQARRGFYDEILQKEPLAQAVTRTEACQLLNKYPASPSIDTTSFLKSNVELMQWVKNLLVS